MKGIAFDVAADVRAGSPTFAQCYGDVQLPEKDGVNPILQNQQPDRLPQYSGILK